MRNPIEAAAKLNYALRLDDRAGSERALGPASVRSGDPDATRVLLLGNGPATGWGVLSHRSSLTGALSRSLGERLGTPVDIDHIGDDTMNVASAVSWLGRRSLDEYAGVVVVIGTSDAVRLVPVPKWRADFERLLQTLENRTHPAARITVAGIQPVRSVVGFDTAFGLLGQRHALRLNDASHDLSASHARVDWTPMPAPADGSARVGAAATTYAAWAEHLAATAGPPLPSASRQVPRGVAAPDPIEQLPAAARPLVDGSRPSSELRSLTEAAKRRLRVDAAMVTLMTEDDQYFAASTTIQPTSVPRELTYCDAVVTADAPLVVPNAKRDPRYRDNPYLDVTHLPFYAGVPLHDAAGTAIGTFCVFSALPKPAGHVDLAELQAFAREAELELQSQLARGVTPRAPITVG